ncbi:DUF3990 domain-containing protein [Agrobacterium rubi]|nr:DUF3990 domain-containing protein [Agrobacterium rubi]NTF23979.1 DUF3990 domain-containing protein [Agrobacterium rubi]
MADTIHLCHGSTHDIDVFDLSMTRDGCAYGRGFYFSNDIALGRTYSDGEDPYVARITYANPYVVDLDRPYEENVGRRMFRPNKGIRERLVDLGFDCVLVRQDGYVEMVVLHPEMVENLGRMSEIPSPESALQRP